MADFTSVLDSAVSRVMERINKEIVRHRYCITIGQTMLTSVALQKLTTRLSLLEKHFPHLKKEYSVSSTQVYEEEQAKKAFKDKWEEVKCHLSEFQDEVCLYYGQYGE